MRRKVIEVVLGVVVLGALVVGTAGCGSTDISAFSVNGDETSQKTVNDDLKALRDNQAFRQLADRDAAGGGLKVSEHPNSVTSALTATWMTDLVRDDLVKIALAKKGVKAPTAADRAEAASLVRQQGFGSPAAFAAFPKSFRDSVIERQARFLALARAAGLDLETQQGQTGLGALLFAAARKAHVTVDPRYGTWSPKRLEVVAPRAPGAPKVRTVNPNSGG
jgi:hypothetical protein